MKQDIDAALARLAEAFPQTFVLEKYRPHWPLKVGIAAAIPARCPAVEWRVLKVALTAYTGRVMYLKGMVAGAARLDLDGNVAGEVTVRDAEYAAAKLAKTLVSREAAAVAAKGGERVKPAAVGAGKMGGYGSGQQGGRATIESAWRFDIDTLVRAGAIKPGAYVEGNLNLPSCDDELAIEFKSSATNPRDSWLRLRYAIRDYWTGEQHQIDDKIYLTASRPWFGGQRWWFVCPTENRRVRKLYLPLGARRFRSRGAYRLAYASQRETVHDRAMRRARKLRRRLGDDPMDGHYPEKPPRMRGATYDRLLDKLIAANRIADERMLLLASKLGAGRPPRPCRP